MATSERYYLTEYRWELRELLIPILEWVVKNGGKEEEGCPIHLHMNKDEKNSM